MHSALVYANEQYGFRLQQYGHAKLIFVAAKVICPGSHKQKATNAGVRRPGYEANVGSSKRR